jgi:hypothetical protein
MRVSFLGFGDLLISSGTIAVVHQSNGIRRQSMKDVQFAIPAAAKDQDMHLNV